MSVVSPPQDERQFVSSFMQLISLSNEQSNEYFNSTSDYYKLTSLGPTLPPVEYELPKGGTVEDKKINLTLKSIKPPFKFSTELKGVSSSETIFRVKSLLIESLELLHKDNVDASNIKFLVKGKVIQDSSKLSSLPNYEEGVSFMCMVSPPAAASPGASAPTTTPSASTPSADPEPSVPMPTKVSTESWTKIFGILKEDIKDEDTALTLLKKFQASV